MIVTFFPLWIFVHLSKLCSKYFLKSKYNVCGHRYNIISIKYLSCHVVGGEACNKHLFTRNKLYLLMIKIVQFLRRVCLLLAPPPASVWICPVFWLARCGSVGSRVCSRRKCCLQCKAEAVKPRPSNPSMSRAMFCPHRPRCCKHYRQHWRLCFCATGHTLFWLSIGGHHFDHLASSGSLGRQATFYIFALYWMGWATLYMH